MNRVLRCTRCRGLMTLRNNMFICECGQQYHVNNTIVYGREVAAEGNDHDQSDKLIFSLKEFFKKHPRLFNFLYYTLGTYIGTSAKQAVASLPVGAVILNLGAGVAKIRDDVINVDYFPYAGVDIVADVHQLPFKDESIDAVIAESLLEHVRYPQEAVREIKRILKPGGLIYISTPFIIGFHSSPGDYYRWTDVGLRELLNDFKEQTLGIAVGPTNALTFILREWLALIFSFNIAVLHQFWVLFFMVIFAPLNWADYVLGRFNAARNIAHIFYFIGSKK